MPTALVTGANGFIGSHLCETLVARGWKVLALVRKTSDLRWLEGVPVTRCYGEVSDRASLSEPAGQAEFIFHLAGVVKTRHPQQFELVNRDGTRNLLDASAGNRRLRKFVLFSTLAAGGPSDDEGEPVSRYGASKRAAEDAVKECAARLPVAVLRLPATYGPRDRESLMMFKTVKWRVVPITDLTFSVCYVQDAVEASILLAESPDSRPEACTVCDGAVHDYDEFARVVGELLGLRTMRVRIPRGMVRFAAWWNERLSPEMPILNRDKARELTCDSWICTNEKLQACCGFQPRFDLRTGARLTIDWYQRHKLL